MSEKANPNRTYKRPKELNTLPDKIDLRLDSVKNKIDLRFGNVAAELNVSQNFDGTVSLVYPDTQIEVMKFDDMDQFFEHF